MHSNIAAEPYTATVTVLFCDVVASTERQAQVGDDAADHFRRSVFALLTGAVEETRGEVVKTMGDGMMVVFRDSVSDALACATRMHDSIEALGVEPPAQLRVGVSAGEAASENDDWFGTPVVEAARLCACAGGGETLVTDVVRVLVGTRGGHELRAVGTRALKGIAQPVAVASAVRARVDAPRAKRAKRTASARTRIVVALIFVIATTSAAVVTTRPAASRGASAVYAPRATSIACSAQVVARVAGATCGRLSVPENRAQPDARWIDVSFTRYPARHPRAGAEPVIEVASELDAAEIVDDPAQSPARDDSDLIVFGGRGLASSTPSLMCPEYTLGPEMLRKPRDDSATITRGQAQFRACHDRLVAKGIALDHYTSLDEAADVVDLTHALHIDHANLQGIWDGARVALATAREAPDVVRTMTLVDPEVPKWSFLSDPTRSLSEAFSRYIALCDADTRCRSAYPDLAASFRTDVARQDAHPQLATPIDVVSGTLRVTVAQPPVFVDGNRLAQGLAAALTSSAHNLPLLAAGIAYPDATVSASLALAQNFPLVVDGFAWGGFLSRLCSYEAHTRTAGVAITDNARAEFRGYDDPALQWMCDAWQVPRTGDVAFEPMRSDVPTLVVEQQLDPRWQPDVTAQLRAQLDHIDVLSFRTLPGGAVPADFPACYGALRRQFLRDPKRALNTDSCARQSPLIDFVVPTR